MKPNYCDDDSYRGPCRADGGCANLQGGHCSLLDVDLHLKPPRSWADIRNVNWGFIPACQVKARQSRKVAVKRTIAENDPGTQVRLKAFRDFMRG